MLWRLAILSCLALSMGITCNLMKIMKVSFKTLTLATAFGMALLSPIAGEDRGRELFMINCQTCHGPDGKGNTVVGQALKARDLTSEPFKQGATVGAITHTIAKGVPGTGMAGFPHINKNDRMALARYIVSIHKPAGQAAAPVAAKTAEAPKPVATKAPAAPAPKAAPAPVVKKEAPKVEKKAPAPVATKTPAAPAPAKAEPVAAAAPAGSEMVNKGRDLYKKNGCNSCHGDDLLAATPTGMALKARNLVKDEYKQGATVEGIMATLKNGVPGTAMAAFPQIAEADSKAISTFIAAVRSGSAPAIDASASAGAAAGSNNKVSITYAMSLMAEDLRNPLKMSFASDSLGAKVYAENCASCHGANGQGQMNAKMISSAPFYRVKTQALLGHKGYWISDKAAFTKLVTEGLAGRLMPGNGTLTRSEIDALYDYLRGSAF